MSITEQRGSLPLERWIQHAIQALTVIAIAWIGTTLNNLTTSDAVTQVKLDAIKVQMADFNLRTANRYTASMALEAHKVFNNDLHDHEQRLRKLENNNNE